MGMEKFYFGKGVLPSFFDELIDRCYGNPLTSDPDTTEWGTAQAGYGWFNTTEKIPKLWDGTEVKALILPPDRVPLSFSIFEKDSMFYAFSFLDGYACDEDEHSEELINRTLSRLPNYGSLYVKGHVVVEDTIRLDGNLMAGANGYKSRFWFIFDRLEAKGDFDLLEVKNLYAHFFRVEGKNLYNPTNDCTHALLKLQDKVANGFFHIDRLDGDFDTGKTLGIHIDVPTGMSCHNNHFKIQRIYCVEKALFLQTGGTGWASINRFDFGYMEAWCPRQIHIQNNATQGIHNNTIRGVGGSYDAWNPQTLAPVYAIKLETTSTGKIVATTFLDYHIYSPVDEIYRADSEVYGTVFIGGMPYMNKTAWWHDSGQATEFLSCWLPASYGRYTKLSGQSQIIEHHTGDDTLTLNEPGTVHTNLGAGGAVTLTLPQDALPGMAFEFVVMAAQQLRIDPGAAGAVYINGAKQTDDKYVWADDEGESVKLVADGNGDWIAIGAVGTWGVEV